MEFELYEKKDLNENKAEQSAEVREEFRVAWEFQIVPCRWETAYSPAIDLQFARESVNYHRRKLTRSNIRIETRTVTTTKWAPVPEEMS